MESLLDYLEQDEAEFYEQLGHSQARTEVDSRIDWLLERITKRQTMIAENNVIADARVAQIEDWRQGENDKLDRSIQWFRYQIQTLIPPDANTFAERYGKKSRALPFGVIGYKKHPDKVEVFDADKALAWAKARNLPVNVKETVSKTTLKEALAKENTDEGDGFQLAHGMDEFYVKANDDQVKQGRQ